MTTYRPFSVVDVPFPFIDAAIRKTRPALVLSDTAFQEHNGAVILAMITSAERSSWNGDVELRDWRIAGLRKPSIVRWKIFTIETALIASERRLLSEVDAAAVRSALVSLFAGALS